jgi:hypothetical protein
MTMQRHPQSNISPNSLGSEFHPIYLFICAAFNDAFSSSDYAASNERMIVNNELESMWKESVEA